MLSLPLLSPLKRTPLRRRIGRKAPGFSVADDKMLDEEHSMAKKDRIVIVTDKFDPHTDIVMIALRNLGCHPVRLHPADFPLSASVTLTLDQQHWSGKLDLPKGSLYLDDVKSI